MARRTAGRKAYQVLDFITGLEDRTIRAALAGHGFSDGDLERGWELLRGLGRARRPARRASPSEAEVSGPLDAWENRWFVVADAALAANHPKVHTWLFRRLTRQSGFRVVLSVSALIDRLRKLEQGVSQLGEEAGEARALLERRGLTNRVLSEAERLLEDLKGVSVSQSDLEPHGDVDAAEAAMWNWYLEWSRIARGDSRAPVAQSPGPRKTR